MFCGFREGARDRLGSFHRQVLDRLGHNSLGFLGRQFAPDDL